MTNTTTARTLWTEVITHLGDVLHVRIVINVEVQNAWIPRVHR